MLLPKSSLVLFEADCGECWCCLLNICKMFSITSMWEVEHVTYFAPSSNMRVVKSVHHFHGIKTHCGNIGEHLTGMWIFV